MTLLRWCPSCRKDTIRGEFGACPCSPIPAADSAEDKSACPIARRLPDGSMRILVDPERRPSFHRPSTTVPPLQWSPATGITRYEWARRHTPEKQRAFFEHLRRVYRARPPRLLPEDLVREMIDSTTDQPNGTRGFEDAAYEGFAERVDEYEIHTTDPTGQWRFHLAAELWRGELCDRLAVSCRDYRTLPDWALLVRLRSWILDDSREAFIWLPDTNPTIEGWERRYENARFNNLQMISPRLVSNARQSPCRIEEE